MHTENGLDDIQFSSASFLNAELKQDGKDDVDFGVHTLHAGTSFFRCGN